MPSVTLPDGKILEVEQDARVIDVVTSIHPGLARKAVAAKVEGELVDLTALINQNASLEVLTEEADEALEVLRHSTAHIMAMAVGRLFPGAKFAIGPVIENGFFYDFDLPRPLTEEDLPKIEAAMRAISKENLPVSRRVESKADALQQMHDHEQVYKAEIIDDIDSDQFSFYSMGDFTDLCRGPHIAATGKAKHFKLLSHSAAYWRGNETNPVLQRIYGTAFFKKADLEAYLLSVEEAKKRDHRKLGKELDLFSFHEEGPGFPFYHPRGTVVFNQLLELSRQMHRTRGYQEIITPSVLAEELWHQSGHWDNYKENMYFTEVANRSFAIKPMNCPGGTLVYSNKLHSYRDLPVRMSELGKVHRYEKSGVMHGLFRARAFTQDDAHIYCTPDQIEDEIVGVIDFLQELYAVFGFNDIQVGLSTRPEKSIGSDEIWEAATNGLRGALERVAIDYQINPGEGVFYGPKIDIHIKDSLGRQWQCGTIQLDFSMPERFGLEYVGPNSERLRPVMIHRALYGSVERFMGILIEHYAGAFPVWLAPVQAVVLSLTERHTDYATGVEQTLTARGVRVETDLRNEKVGLKIREHSMQKIPYLIIVGDEEENDSSVAIRQRGEGDIGKMPVAQFADRICLEIEEKR